MTREFVPCGLAVAMALFWADWSEAQVFFSEIMYHPVERAAFDDKGVPTLDLSDDVHEFIELHNTSGVAVSLERWRLSGGISFGFPPGTAPQAGGFVFIAKNPARVAS